MDPNRSEYEQAKEMIPKLTPKQQEALSSVAMGGLGLGCSRITLESLEAKGLVTSVDVPIPGWPPVTHRVYLMEFGPTHMAWCEWAASKYEEGCEQ